MKVTDQNRSDIFKKGWTIIDMGFSKKEIKRYYKSTLLLKKKALEINYPLQRCYYPHLFHKNISAIESPFNKLIINKGVEELFQRINIGETLNFLLGWEKSYLHLARLFTMENYKYRGNWHRDFDDWDGKLTNLDKIQIAIYLKDQDGFRIFDYNLDSKSKNNLSNRKDPHPYPLITAKTDKKFYNEIKGKAGTLLIFAPGIIHQGNSFDSRLDFHLRFSYKPLVHNDIKINYGTVNDYQAPDFYQKNFEIENDKFSARIRKVSAKEKLLNSLNYYTGAKNLIFSLKFLLNNSLSKKHFPDNWDFDPLGNTIFQSK